MDPNVARAKLAGLSDMLDDLLRVPVAIFSVQNVRDLFLRFAAIRDALMKSHAELFDDMPERRVSLAANVMVEREHLETLRRDISYSLTLLDAGTRADKTLLQLDREGVFFAGEVFDALRHIDGLIRQAQRRILIVDGYAGESVLALLAAKKPGVTVEIMMKPSQATATFKTHGEAFNAQYQGLAVRTSEAFHDRFVIIDDNDVYHFGASLKDAGRKGFMFSRLEEPSVLDELRKRIAAEWQKANVLL
jgi:hypothetical protein